MCCNSRFLRLAKVKSSIRARPWAGDSSIRRGSVGAIRVRKRSGNPWVNFELRIANYELRQLGSVRRRERAPVPQRNSLFEIRNLAMAEFRKFLAGDFAVVPGDGLGAIDDRLFVALAADDDDVAGLGTAERHGDGFPAIFDLEEVRAASFPRALGVLADFADDCRGVFAARILVREDGEVGAFGGGPPHSVAAAGVAFAGSPDDQDQFAACHMT